MPPEFDATAYRQQQRQEWDRAASGWERWWPKIEEGAQVVSDRLLELAAVAPGQRVLDIATGIGEPAVSAARRVGPEGAVVGADQSAGMLEIARRRVQSLGLANVEFREAGVEDLDLPEAAVDAALCRWGLMFFPDLTPALSAVRGWVRPGGRFAATVWTAPSDALFLGIPMRVASQRLGLQPPPPGAPGLFRFQEPESLDNALRDAGWDGVEHEFVDLSFEFASSDELLTMIGEVAVPYAAAMAQLDDEGRREVDASVRAELARFEREDGGLRFDSRTYCVSARAP